MKQSATRVLSYAITPARPSETPAVNDLSIPADQRSEYWTA